MKIYTIVYDGPFVDLFGKYVTDNGLLSHYLDKAVCCTSEDVLEAACREYNRNSGNQEKYKVIQLR